MTPLNIESIETNLKEAPQTWLVTGAAGFIASNISDYLLNLNQTVIGLDNFSTGLRTNVERLQSNKNGTFTFYEEDIRNFEGVEQIVKQHGVKRIIHQAALGSVPRSIDNPTASHDSNVNGFLTILEVARKYDTRVVYASSSSVYGDSPNLPKVEDEIGNVLSPYAATKRIDEIYADVYNRIYGLNIAGLRYFNVFGPYQNPEGAYAAVIPRWYACCLNQTSPSIFGDGETTRDFCFVKNAVQANILACENMQTEKGAQVYNIAAEKRVTLNELLENIQKTLAKYKPNYKNVTAEYKDFRAGDIRHSLADVSKAKEHLGYNPKYTVIEGIAELSDWYSNL